MGKVLVHVLKTKLCFNKHRNARATNSIASSGEKPTVSKRAFKVALLIVYFAMKVCNFSHKTSKLRQWKLFMWKISATLCRLFNSDILAPSFEGKFWGPRAESPEIFSKILSENQFFGVTKKLTYWPSLGWISFFLKWEVLLSDIRYI